MHFRNLQGSRMSTLPLKSHQVPIYIFSCSNAPSNTVLFFIPLWFVLFLSTTNVQKWLDWKTQAYWALRFVCLSKHCRVRHCLKSCPSILIRRDYSRRTDQDVRLRAWSYPRCMETFHLRLHPFTATTKTCGWNNFLLQDSVIKGTWKKGRWDKRNVSAHLQNFWVLPYNPSIIKCWEPLLLRAALALLSQCATVTTSKQYDTCSWQNFHWVPYKQGILLLCMEVFGLN